MATSINGWPANNPSLIASQLIPGTQVKVRVRADAPGLLLLEVASAFDRLVEDIDNVRGGLDDWGYAERPIRGGSATSNHASGTAVDIDALRHPFQKKGTFTKAQVATIHTILKAALGVVDWGGDWTSPVDEMHIEIAPGKTMQDCQRALVAMRAFNNGDDELSAQFEAAMTAKFDAFLKKYDVLEKDLRADLHVKQLQTDQLVKLATDTKATLVQHIADEAAEKAA